MSKIANKVCDWGFKVQRRWIKDAELEVLMHPRWWKVAIGGR